MSKTLVMLASALLLVCAVAGCGSESGRSDERATVIYRGNGGEPGSLDPAVAEDIHAFNVLSDLYEGLVSLSADGQPEPGVAESWSVSADGLTYSFRLRENALWSNGDKVTADHFVNAYRRVKSPQSTSAYAFLFDPVLDYVAIDESTLEIRLIEPAPHLIAVLSMPIAFPMPAIEMEPGSFASPEKFVGNGAYLLSSREAGGAVHLRRNSLYREDVAIDEIVFLPIVDPLAELNMFRSGELDITHTIPIEHITALRQSAPNEVRIAPSLALYYLAFDLTEPPFNDPALRHALSMAIDREQLVELIGRGERPAFGIVPDGIPGYGGAQVEWSHFSASERRSRALELYNAAGYDESEPLTVKYTYDTGDIHEKVALIVASMWHETLGIDVQLEKKEWQYFLDTRDQRSEWQVMRFAWFGDYNHASTFTNIFRSTDEQNLSQFDNPQYDSLLAAASREPDPGRQADLLAEAETLLLAEHPIAPLYFFVSKHLVASHIGGFDQNALDRHPSRFLYLEADD